jgi:hypothetical protein
MIVKHRVAHVGQGIERIIARVHFHLELVGEAAGRLVEEAGSLYVHSGEEIEERYFFSAF